MQKRRENNISCAPGITILLSIKKISKNFISEPTPLSEMQLPLVTVVTVTYNSSAYVRDAIESILASSCINFELIIGDDCSKDNTWSIVNEYQDTRIVRYRNEQNIGEYPNRNKAIELAKGEYLLFIDGDDMIYPHGLEFMVKMLHAFPNCAMALMRWFRNDLFFPVIISPEQFYIGEYFGNSFLGTAFSNILFRTKILKANGGLSTRFRAGDDYIRYKIGATYDSLIIGDGLTWWRETPGQASQLFNSSFDGFMEVYEMKFMFLAESNCPLKSVDKIIAKENLEIILAKKMIKLLLGFRIKRFLILQSRFGLHLGKLLKASHRLTSKNPLEGFSPTNPHKLPFYVNPYSSSYSING
jgi:glycosyltransferase involved in cell wall biosynthesis